MKESFWRNLQLSAWELWERFFSQLFQIREVHPGGLSRLNTRRYPGPALELQDGTTIEPGELVGELHLSNRKAMQLQQGCINRVKAFIAIKKEMKRELSYLATLVAEGGVTPDVPAYYAITLMHPFARSLGFEVRDFDNKFLAWLYKAGQLLLLSAYHPAGLGRLQQGHQGFTPKYRLDIP